MGREWLYNWVGGGGGGGSDRRSSPKKRRMSEEMKEAATSAGCMCAVFQIFDLHHFQSPLNNDQHNTNKPASLPQEATTSFSGVEAPRNSLESHEPLPYVNSAPSTSLALKEEENLNIPLGIQIKTSRSKTSSPRVSTISRSDEISSEYSSTNSPGTKTPTLVARLMGLDLLSECTYPSISSSSPKPHPKSRFNRRKDSNFLLSRSNRTFSDDNLSISARSLPETPRISLARRSDVEFHTHRLSLRINKENVNGEFEICDKMGTRRERLLRDENTSPGHYARQIVKNVKDRVSRRVGLDITNTLRNKEHYRRDENLILLKPTTKTSKISSRFDGEISPDDSKQPIATTSSIKNSSAKSPRVSQSSETYEPCSSSVINSITGTRNPLVERNKQQKESKKDDYSSAKCSSSSLRKLPHQACEHVMRSKKEEQFVGGSTSKAINKADKKHNRSPLSSDILSLLLVKKDPSPPPTKLPQKQVADGLSSKRSTHLLSSKPIPYSYKPPTTTTNGGAWPEYGDYILKILKRAAVVNNKFNPIDPSILHYLKLFHSTTAAGKTILIHRCNRKLIFQLVDELLAEISTPNFDLNATVEELCKKIDGFPAANCLVLEDIDALIDKDLSNWGLVNNGGFLEEEEESIVCEIEGGIVERLVRETVAAVVVGSGAAEGKEKVIDATW